MWLITKAIYLFIWISATQEKYFVSETKSEWSEEKDENCTFAKPPLTFLEKKVTTQLDGVDTTDDIWVGYFRKNTEMEYIGCVAETDIAHTSALTGSSKDPGYCFTICKHRGTNGIIGIIITKCYCLIDNHIQNLNLTRPYCKSPCTSGSGVACGGVLEMENFVSLYRLNYNVTGIVEQEGSCLQFEPIENRYFMWQDCLSSGFPVVCTTHDQNSLEILAYTHWITATVHCFSRNSISTNYTHSKTAVVTTGSSYWTGVIRSYVIYDFDAKVPSHSDIEFGYLTKAGSAYELKFGKTDVKKHYLCVRDVSTATTTVSTSLNVTPVVSSTVISKNQTLTSYVNVYGTTIISHTDRNITVYSHLEESRGLKDSDVIVPVAVSLSVVLVIVISIAAFVVLRKLGKIPELCKNISSTDKTSQQQYENTVEHAYDRLSQTRMDGNSFYTELGTTKITGQSGQDISKTPDMSKITDATENAAQQSSSSVERTYDEYEHAYSILSQKKGDVNSFYTELETIKTIDKP